MSVFTKMLLNPGKRSGRNLLLNPQKMHAAISGSLPPDKKFDINVERVLWRIDTKQADSRVHEHTLYIVSPEKPDMSALMEQVGWETRPPAHADYEPLLDSLMIGQQWRFKLRANPVHSVKTGDPSERGRIHPHVSVSHQAEWLEKRSENHGFILLDGWEDASSSENGARDADQSRFDATRKVKITNRDVLDFAHLSDSADSKRRITLRSVEYEGILQITDREKFRRTLIKGIGRGRAYGQGLMTVAKLR